MTWIINRTSQFEKNYKNLAPYLKEKFKSNFSKFLIDYKTPSLNTHKLKWKLSNYYSSKIDYDYRFITLIDFQNDTITLVNIWNHSIYK